MWSLPDFSAPTSSLVKVVDPEKGGYLKPPAAEGTSGKLDTVSIAASNGLLVSGAPAVSLTAATSNNNTHQMSTAAPVIFTPSVSVSDYIPSGTGSIGSTTSSGIMFGAAEAPKVSGEPAFKFGASPDPSAKVSDVSTTIIPAGDLKTKALADSSSGIPSSSSTKSVAFGAPSSGNMTSGLSSSINFPSANDSQGSLFSNASKSFVPSVGTVLPGTSAQPFSLASQPTSNMNSGTSFVSSLSSSQGFSPIMSFGSSPATGFSFGASATSSAQKNYAPVVFSSSTAPPSSSPFSFSSAPASVFSSPTPTLAQPVFGNPAPGFAASSPGNNYQMSAEDSMAEDPVQSAAPSVPVFGQTNISPAPGYMFGSSVSSQPNPFQFGGQQIQAVPQNPSMFQASSSVEFNAGGSFSLGSGGGDKSGRKFVKANRNKNRKK